MLNIFSIQDNSHASPSEEVYVVARVVDGDTLVVVNSCGKNLLVRLYGIDCPENGQEFGAAAAQITAHLVSNQRFKLNLLYKDRYGRDIAILLLQDGTTLQEILLKAGAGWVAPRYCKREECLSWREIEQTAREAKMGLWKEPRPVPPWAWRNKPRASMH